MSAIKTRVEQELYPQLLRLAATESPAGWIIVVIKADVREHDGAVTMDYIDASGHVIWHEAPNGVRHHIHQALVGFRSGTAGEEAQWSRAALTLSMHKLISANFWR